MSKVEHGIVLYTIESDTCLNGVYTNERTRVPGTIYNEIAKKFQNGPNVNPLTGSYQCVYFDEGGSSFSHETVTLEITHVAGNLYDFRWHDASVTKFQGKGYIMNRNTVAVNYRSI